MRGPKLRLERHHRRSTKTGLRVFASVRAAVGGAVAYADCCYATPCGYYPYPVIDACVNRRLVIYRRGIMIRSTVVALALTVASSAQSMPYVPLQQPNNLVIPIRQGCGLGRQLVDGICVRNSAVRAAVRKCSSRGMRMVNGRCEPRARPATASGAARPATQQPAATPTTPR
jgi:hypothetical protein